ncbi:MAG: AAA family ATPase [Candidatus Methanomethylophilaceae archaeon]|nr:AAA family ATPase [Candidatus Methanomethylophilaceae archaeon]
MSRRVQYPFTAIVGQEDMKNALILNTVNPRIGGVLIRGEKGTAKSTAVRALAGLLPDRAVVKGCQCGCSWGDSDSFCPDCMESMASGTAEPDNMSMEVVELPLSSTEDRVTGTLDIEHAISTGKKKFEPGILAKANGNILYVDEVNLLDDHIVDLLLDAAAMGRNYVEREGVSFNHPSRFVLVGTMNPEEGDLRPQLLDRFGLMVDIKGEQDESRRSEIIRRRMEFERDPEAFNQKYEQSNMELRDMIVNARDVVDDIIIDDDAVTMAARTSIHLGVDGHRSDLTLIKTACAKAALEGRDRIDPEDVVSVSHLVLPHRMRRNPFQDSNLDITSLEQWMRSALEGLR